VDNIAALNRRIEMTALLILALRGWRAEHGEGVQPPAELVAMVAACQWLNARALQ